MLWEDAAQALERSGPQQKDATWLEQTEDGLAETGRAVVEIL